MRGLKISFEDEGFRLLPEESVSGFEANTQNALMHIATIRGSDRVYPDRGTTILTESVRGVVLSKRSMSTLVTKGAGSAQTFSRQYEPETNGDSLVYVRLTVEDFRPGFASLSAYFKSDSGLELGETPLTLAAQ